MDSSRIVAGIDVGGSAKGFHAVALENGAYLDKFASLEYEVIAEWCRRIGAGFIGVDAPCHWSDTGRARTAERDLMKEKIWCFSTPTKQIAVAHPKDHFRWMLNGAALFESLQSTHALFAGDSTLSTQPLCFETFPHAIACALAGSIVSAKKKSTVRRNLLNRDGVDTNSLSNIDQLDAALCALAAKYFALNHFKTYGDVMTGFIVVPRSHLA